MAELIGRAVDRWLADTTRLLLEFASLLHKAVYHKAMAALTTAGRREISLTDWTSFVFRRAHRFRQVFTFHKHFADQGFTLLP